MSNPVPPLERAWEFQADSSIFGLRQAGMTAESSAIIFGSKKGLIYALDAMSGSVKWTFKMGKGLKLPLIEANGVVYAPSKDKKLYALDSRTGDEIWLFSSGKDFVNWVEGPVLAEGVVYVTTKDKKLHAVNAETGERRWQFSSGGEISCPAVAYGTVFFGCEDKHVYAVDSSSGSRRWMWKSKHKNHSVPILADDKVLIAADDNLYAFEPDNGTVLWEVRDVLHYGRPPTVAGGHAYCTKELVGLDLSSGKVAETFTPTMEKMDSTLVRGTTLYVEGLVGKTIPLHTANVILAYDLSTKEEQWHTCIRSLVTRDSWDIANGFIFVTTINRLIVINTSRVTKRWESEGLPGGLMADISRPVIGHGMVFVSYGKGLHAFRSSEDSAVTHAFEVGDEVSPSPIYEVETLRKDVVWPDCCCLCCGPAEVHVDLSEEFAVAGLTQHAVALGVPYCRNCQERTSGFRREKPGISFESAVPTTYVFRNERYWARFLEANRLR
jgi:outer membrane protein assembly factor BamB